ncbi:MAG: peptidylprolyl isomerase [Bacteroidetes bacterium]|nr:peptidylprolyl isomerase [Bacteroidota bacterium]
MQKLRLSILLSLLVAISFAQPQVIDKVIGIVGKYPILLSDLQNSLIEREKQEEGVDKCKAFETLVFQKLLVAQADRDSVVVSDAEVDQELNQRMAYYIQQFGSEEKLEEFYGKRTNVIKDELRSDVQEQLIAQKMQGKITGDVKLTPSEIRQFYNSIPQDSLPLINSEVELEQIVKKPTFSAEAKKIAKEQLEEYRERVVKGESMKKLAILYTEDPGSQSTGGFYTFTRGQFDPAFESVAFRLKEGEVSHVFESTYGYHFIELVKRKGEFLDVRHILIIPKMTNADFFNSKLALDSIYTDIKEGKITFEDAARKYSDDADTKQNGGLMINRSSATTKFNNDDLSQIDQNLVATLNSMQIGEISKPMQFVSPTDGKPGYRLLKLKNRIDPHRTNMKDDYQKLAAMAQNDYNKKQVKEWIKKRSKITYIKLDPEYTCAFENQWTINSN